MEAQQQRLDAISNDLANLNTTGYQSQRVGFQDLLYNGVGAVGAPGVTIGTGAAVVSLGPSQVAGPIQQTGSPLDLAINGDGFFQVRQADGSTALTRDGQLQLDASGQLTNAAGLLVQPPVKIPAGVDPHTVKIAGDGSVTTDGKTLGKVSLFTVPSPEQLIEASGNLLLPTAASGAVRPAATATMQQGALNGSDVNLARAMTEMVDAQQAYGLASRAITIEQQMGQIANGVKQ
jgi:flagellar basal-body rod protein FlgG